MARFVDKSCQNGQHYFFLSESCGKLRDGMCDYCLGCGDLIEDKGQNETEKALTWSPTGLDRA